MKIYQVFNESLLVTFKNLVFKINCDEIYAFVKVSFCEIGAVRGYLFTILFLDLLVTIKI